MILKKHRLDVAFGATWTKVSKLDVRCEDFDFQRYTYILDGKQYDNEEEFRIAFEQHKAWMALSGNELL